VYPKKRLELKLKSLILGPIKEIRRRLAELKILYNDGFITRVNTRERKKNYWICYSDILLFGPSRYIYIKFILSICSKGLTLFLGWFNQMPREKCSNYICPRCHTPLKNAREIKGGMRGGRRRVCYCPNCGYRTMIP